MDHEDTTSYIQEVIRSAIVPVAGVATRLLPATKSQPKEMLPVARKPIVQYVAEELIANKVDQILFITGRNKTSIENDFDTYPFATSAPPTRTSYWRSSSSRMTT